jgi:hypothetical protein
MMAAVSIIIPFEVFLPTNLSQIGTESPARANQFRNQAFGFVTARNTVNGLRFADVNKHIDK